MIFYKQFAPNRWIWAGDHPFVQICFRALQSSCYLWHLFGSGKKVLFFRLQFLTEWKQLNTPEGRFKYVQLLQDPTKDYPKIFKHSMESSIFDELIDLFSTPSLFGDSAEVCRHLLGISRVPRISAHVMFLDSGNLQRLQKLVDVNVSQTSLLSDIEKKEIVQKFK